MQKTTSIGAAALITMALVNTAEAGGFAPAEIEAPVAIIAEKQASALQSAVPAALPLAFITLST